MKCVHKGLPSISMIKKVSELEAFCYSYHMNKKILKIMSIVTALIAISVLAYFPLSTLLRLQAASALNGLGFTAGYETVQSNCPTNVELQLVCLKRYYSAKDNAQIENEIKTVIDMHDLESFKFTNGYDGGSQVAYAAYDSLKNVSYIFVIVSTNNEAYKKHMGNFRVETYLSKSKFENSK